MTNSKYKFFLCFLLTLTLHISSKAQELWSIDQVLAAIKENNFDLKSARQNIVTAEILNSKLNQGYLPTLAATAGLGYNLNGIKQIYNFNFPDLDIQNIQAYNGNIGISSSYLLYDAGQRKLRNEKNNSNLDAAYIQEDNIRQLLGFSAMQLYYNIAQAIFTIDLLNESLAISQQRYQRAITLYEYGNQNKVDVLNAEVDVARDSLNLNAVLNDIKNLKWQLNQLTLREDTNYQVDTSFQLVYQQARLSDLHSKMLESNKELKVLEKNIELVNYDLALADKLNTPQVFANGAYNLSYQKNSKKSQIDLNRSNGLNLGLSANWNIFDGGQRKLQNQLAIVDLQNTSIALDSKKNELHNQINRLWNTYQNNLLIIRIELQNIHTNRVNFELVKSLYENGQQSSVEFRQAQLNLINAQSQYYRARTTAKLQEVELDYLLGK